jgi:hypothetical protein
LNGCAARAHRSQADASLPPSWLPAGALPHSLSPRGAAQDRPPPFLSPSIRKVLPEPPFTIFFPRSPFHSAREHNTFSFTPSTSCPPPVPNLVQTVPLSAINGEYHRMPSLLLNRSTPHPLPSLVRSYRNSPLPTSPAVVCRQPSGMPPRWTKSLPPHRTADTVSITTSLVAWHTPHCPPAS